jgi:sugar-specific transcriptional regulator TrmB
MSEENTILSDALSAFALSKSELAVYRASMELGARPASIIARRAGLNRPYTYDILAMLTKKGLVQEVRRNSVKQFSCTPPDDLVEIVRRREEKLSSQKQALVTSLPLLKQLSIENNSHSDTRQFRGVDRLKAMLDETLIANDQPILSLVETAFCGSLLEGQEHAYTRRYRDRLLKRRISYKGISCSKVDKKTKKPSSKITEIRSFNSPIELPFEVFIYGPKIALIPREYGYFGVVFENEILADSARSTHETLWRSLDSH